VTPLALLLGCVLAGGCATAAAAARPASELALVEAISAAPANRAALREDLVSQQAKRLAAWRAEGVLTSYRLLFNRYSDAGSWDAMEILTFADPAAQARWNAVERTAPAGLDPRALSLVTAISSTPTDFVRRGAAGSASPPGGPFLVIPYDALVSVPEYLKYIDGYTIPQMKGWMEAGALAGYGLHVGRYYAGRPWTALLVLDYRDEAALARREAVVAAVRARLAHDPAWKAISDNKKAMRAEKQLAVADQLAMEGAGP
jgi:hypothetical protein